MTSRTTDPGGYVELIRYELTEFVQLSGWVVLDDWPFKTGADQTFRSALLEADLVHARCLLEFLLNNSQRKNVVASHFASSWSPPDEPKLKDIYERICQYLSHLSKTRVGSPPPEWNIPALSEMIIDALEDLARNLGFAEHEQTFRSLTSWARTIHDDLLSPVVNGSVTSTNFTFTQKIGGSTGLPYPPS